MDKKSYESMNEKYRYIKTDRTGVSVEKLCQILQISRSGYYAWNNRKPSARTRSNQALTRALVRLHEKYPALGLDSLYHLLKKKYPCSRKRVHRLMRKNGIFSARLGVYKTTTNSNHNYSLAPNLLKRKFSFAKPNQAWVGDITYIPTGEGWLYLAIVKDLCTRKIVGYAFFNRIDTKLTLDALNMAFRRESPQEGLIFHSDRGVQYTSSAFRHRLAQLHIWQSMSRKGDPYDNAVAENFFSCLKCELIHLHRFDTCSVAQNAVFSYIEAFYNTLRPHSALGWISPCTFHQTLFLPLVA